MLISPDIAGDQDQEVQRGAAEQCWGDGLPRELHVPRQQRPARHCRPHAALAPGQEVGWVVGGVVSLLLHQTRKSGGWWAGLCLVGSMGRAICSDVVDGGQRCGEWWAGVWY